jgi:hypothetical protein
LLDRHTALDKMSGGVCLHGQPVTIMPVVDA